MKHMFVILGIAALGVTGCATVEPGALATKSVAATSPTTGDLFGGVAPGMRREDAAAKLDGIAVAGVEIDPVSGQPVPQNVRTLVSTEIVEANGISYQVDVYLPKASPDASGAVGQVAAGAPCPFIFQDGVLVGRGGEELRQLKARAAIGAGHGAAQDKQAGHAQ